MSAFSQKPYHAGTFSFPSGASNAPLFESIWGSNFMKERTDRTLAILLIYNSQIKVKFNSVDNDQFILRNPSSTAVPLHLDDLFPPSVMNVREIYITNDEAATCQVDVLIIPRTTNTES